MGYCGERPKPKRSPRDGSAVAGGTPSAVSSHPRRCGRFAHLPLNRLRLRRAGNTRTGRTDLGFAGEGRPMPSSQPLTIKQNETMLWQSNLKSAPIFAKAVNKDPDLVFVARSDGRLSLTVSGASEYDGQMTVIGLNGKWRAHVHREGRRIIAVPIGITPRRK